MTATWEKPKIDASSPAAGSNRWQFLAGGLIMLVAIGYLILSGTATGARYFITVSEVVNDPQYVGQTVRISGAVVGETIQYDEMNLILDFTIAHIPEEFDDPAFALYQAVNDPEVARLPVHVSGQVKPDLLKHEAQAILTGAINEDGIFYATELLLKCPSRYEESYPHQSQTGTSQTGTSQTGTEG